MGGKTPDWMPELFFCHRYEFAVIADQLGFRLGTRSDHFDTNRVRRLLNEDFDIDFVDNDFEDPNKDRIEEIVEKTGADYVVLPDIYDCDDVNGVLEFGDELEHEYGTTPIVVPKCEFSWRRVPDRWLIGFSVPSGYGSTEIPITEFKNHRVHLLGGSHRNQIKFANRAIDAGVDIFSVDGNAFSKASGFGNIVNEPVEILDKDGYLDEKTWVKSAMGYTDWGQRIAQSLARYYELWRQWGLRRGMAGDDVDVESVV
jgi:hypothetical protein